EGTNGIQAIDLVTRKLPLGNGDVARGFIAEMRETARDARSSNDKVLTGIGAALDDALDTLDKATDYMLANVKSAPNDCLAGAAPYLRLFGTAAGGHYLARAALGGKAASRLEIAQFYAANILPAVHGLLAPATAGAESLMTCDSAVFAD
ncbi:MAG TPA: acyl-CoA dehydrogenase, partial [Rhodobiaceae bacterium]|nr:acyl-CoA dehydrogenase [Rhodobiaceae bacterium]